MVVAAIGMDIMGHKCLMNEPESRRLTDQTRKVDWLQKVNDRTG